MEGAQADVIAFLGKIGGSAPVERIDTHASIVFLAGNRAYKLKRAIAFSYLDYSTAELRRRACERELALNRRTAPVLYLAARSINRAPDGTLAIGGEGPAVDWVVVMRRFDEAALFDRLAEAGRLDPASMRRLADEIAAFHRAAEVHRDYGDTASWRETIADNEANLELARDELDAAGVRELIGKSRAALERVAGLIESRREEGKVRRCHGDLHLRNICLIDGRPTLFDCIEFSERIACIDVLYDVAFLLMDLRHRGLNGLASAVFNRYLDMSGESSGLAALPLFMSTRAAIRAHVGMAAVRLERNRALFAAKAAEARSYLGLALALLEREPPRLIALGGLSGSGKSVLAEGLSSDFAHGARVIRSDVVRKRLFGVAPEERLGPSAYTSAMHERVYRALRSEAATALAAGYSAIVDATFIAAAEREAIAALARSAGVPFTGLWLEAQAEVLAARLRGRRDDASDADAAVLRDQLRADTGVVGWRKIDAAGEPEPVLAAARRACLERPA